MLYKPRKQPQIITGLKSLLKRLDYQHPVYSVAAEHLRRNEAGFSGEQFFDKKIRDFKPNIPHALIHDLCLNVNGIFFQIASLLITPDAITIFEVKNFAGKLTIKNDPTQFILGNTVISNPITEVERKEILLNKWLQIRDVSLPIRGMVALAFNNELQISGPLSHTVLPAQEIPILLYRLEIKQHAISTQNIQTLANMFVNAHITYNPFPLIQHYDFTFNDLKTGVFCPSCAQLGMIRARRSWSCLQCNYDDRNAHLATLADWFMLMGPNITNQQFRTFANIQRSGTSKRLLQRAYLEKIGHTKNTSYQLQTFDKLGGLIN
mgnify:CR=1 FL=1